MKLLVLVVTLATVSSLKMQGISDDPPGSRHYWPSAMMEGGHTNVVPPHDLSEHVAWTWHHPNGRFRAVLSGGPVIDSEKSIYFTGQDHVRKLNSDGQQQWEWRSPKATTFTNGINNMPALDGNRVFLADKGGYAYALDAKTGKQLWANRLSSISGGDSGYPSCAQGLFIMASESGPGGGNKKISALSQETGKAQWDFFVDTPVWNFQPLFPNDDTVVFMDLTGGMYKIGIHDGELIWHTPAPDSEGSFSDGGAVLGDNGMAYTCSNPGISGGSEGQLGVLRAFALSDGKILWSQELPQPCNSYPAFGTLGDAKEPSVVITPGSFIGVPTMHGGIMAFDARTGALQWQYQAPVYHPQHDPTDPPSHDYWVKGDFDGFDERAKINDPIVGGACIPAHWSAPTITGDGTVYAARSDGFLYQVRGPASGPGGIAEKVEQNIDYATTPGVEVNRFDTEGCSLHGANAFAPGMFALQNCDSLWVFKF